MLSIASETRTSWVNRNIHLFQTEPWKWYPWNYPQTLHWTHQDMREWDHIKPSWAELPILDPRSAGTHLDTFPPTQWSQISLTLAAILEENEGKSVWKTKMLAQGDKMLNLLDVFENIMTHKNRKKYYDDLNYVHWLTISSKDGI